MNFDIEEKMKEKEKEFDTLEEKKNELKKQYEQANAEQHRVQGEYRMLEQMLAEERKTREGQQKSIVGQSTKKEDK